MENQKTIISQTIDLDQELAPQIPKYSIRTMAQDLERAKKEGLSLTPIKAPATPPPPPSLMKEIVSPAPISIKRVISPFPDVTEIPKIPVTPSMPAPLPEIPPMPAPTPISQPILSIPPIRKPPGTTSLQLKIIISVIIVFAILAGSAGFAYFWFFVRQPEILPPPIEELPPQVKEPEIPPKISPAEKDLIITTGTKLASDEATSLFLSQLSKETGKLENKELARITVKYQTEDEISYLSLNELLALLQIKIPDAVNQNIETGEFLAYRQFDQTRYGFISLIKNSALLLNLMADWEKTVLDDLKNIYIDKSPQKPPEIIFKDDFQENFIIRYINLPDPSISFAWAISEEKKSFAIATSKNMLYKIIGVKEKLLTEIYPSGTLTRAEGDTKIYRIINNKKLWVPTVKAFLDSGYKPYSEIEIKPEDLNKFENVKYIKLEGVDGVYEIRNDKKYIVSDPKSLPEEEIKIATKAELDAYLLGK